LIFAEATAMSLLRPILSAGLLLALTAHAQEFKCPSYQGKNPLFNADVFDGPPEKNVQLEPDASRGNKSYTYALWKIGYLFDLGSTPFLVCKFAGLGDAQSMTIKVDKRVEQCVFRTHGGGQPAEAECK
jgi:hypothetical protein